MIYTQAELKLTILLPDSRVPPIPALNWCLKLKFVSCLAYTSSCRQLDRVPLSGSLGPDTRGKVTWAGAQVMCLESVSSRVSLGTDHQLLASGVLHVVPWVSQHGSMGERTGPIEQAVFKWLLTADLLIWPKQTLRSTRMKGEKLDLLRRAIAKSRCKGAQTRWRESHAQLSNKAPPPAPVSLGIMLIKVGTFTSCPY